MFFGRSDFNDLTLAYKTGSFSLNIVCTNLFSLNLKSKKSCINPTMKSTEKYSKNILLTKFIAFGLPILRRFKTNMQDMKLPRKQGNARNDVNIVICLKAIEGLRKTFKGRASLQVEPGPISLW